MSEEPSQSFFSRIVNLFSSKEEIDKPSNSDQPSDEQIEELIQNVLSIKDSIVKEIMIPRVNISSISETNTLEEIYEIAKDTKHSRYPVFSSDSKKVIGILHVKDLVDIKNDADFNLIDLLREPKYTPETKSVTSLLEDFKKDRAHLAMVIDEYGVLAGLITIEDILEEIVGEIEDEFYEEKNDEVIKINEKEYIVSSIIEKEKFEEFFNIELNCPEAESLGGFVLKEFGHLPKVGESIKVSNLELIVTSADQRKIKKITVRKID
jgi:magnesium and cobalt transporter|tara:strand:+ start:2421 stop:3215 length:795 start_codon:yes stop_codon:yes gene_type:complete